MSGGAFLGREEAWRPVSGGKCPDTFPKRRLQVYFMIGHLNGCNEKLENTQGVQTRDDNGSVGHGSKVRLVNKSWGKMGGS